VPWSDGRQNDETRADHADAKTASGPAVVRRAALRGLEKGRRQRECSEEAILAAIRDFRHRPNRWPSQQDFRSAYGLPGAGTVLLMVPFARRASGGELVSSQ
jgi:hypothetical protein